MPVKLETVTQICHLTKMMWVMMEGKSTSAEDDNRKIKMGVTLIYTEKNGFLTTAAFSARFVGTVAPHRRLLTLITPLILLANLLFLFRGEVVLDVEGDANFLRGFSFDHIGDSLAGKVE